MGIKDTEKDDMDYLNNALKNRKQLSAPTCPICEMEGKIRSVRIPTQCDNCGRTVCKHHRDVFQPHWVCPICQQSQQRFTQPINQTDTSANLGQLATAERLYKQKRIAEAQTIIDQIYIDIMCQGK